MRWYIQNYITKINSTIAKQYLNGTESFSQIDEQETQALVRASSGIDIFHCNIKVPVSKIKDLWTNEIVTGKHSQCRLNTAWQ